MTALEQTLLQVVGRSVTLRRALQRWALRYAAKTLRTMGPLHELSAELLRAAGEAPPVASRAVTRHGMEHRMRRPAGSPQPGRVQLPQLHRDNGAATRTYLAEDDPD